MAKSTNNIITYVIIAALCIALTGTYFYMQSKINEANAQKTTLDATVKQMQENNTALQATITEDENKLSDAQNKLSVREAEYTNYSNKVSRYFSMLHIIAQDSKALSESYDEWYNATDNNEKKVLLSKLKNDISTAKDHLEGYRTLLVDNREFFEGLQIDVDKEVDGVYSVITSYNKVLDNLNSE